MTRLITIILLVSSGWVPSLAAANDLLVVSANTHQIKRYDGTIIGSRSWEEI